jgi:hypothetical protein
LDLDQLGFVIFVLPGFGSCLLFDTIMPSNDNKQIFLLANFQHGKIFEENNTQDFFLHFY